MGGLCTYEGKLVLVGGCATGIGAAVAAGARAEGATVVGLDIVDPGDAVDEYVHADLGDRAQVEAAVAALARPFDAVFLCSGISSGKGLSPLELITINFIGTRALLEGLLPQLRDGAAISLIGSLAAIDVLDRWDELGDFLARTEWDDALAWCEAHEEVLAPTGCYPFSKEAIVAYTLRSTDRLARRGIRINCISPSPVQTPFLKHTITLPGAKDFLASFPIPLGRPSDAGDQADVLLFLGSDAARYLTGQNLWTDGGYTAAALSGDVRPVMGRAARDA